MFRFDDCVEWLKKMADELGGGKLTIGYRDTRAYRSSNPSFSFEVDSPDRLGTIVFWENGLCDYQVIDTASEETVAEEAMLVASDETAPELFARFISYF